MTIVAKVRAIEGYIHTGTDKQIDRQNWLSGVIFFLWSDRPINIDNTYTRARALAHTNTHSHKHKHTITHMYTHTYTYRKRQTDRQIDRQTDKL